MPTHAVTNQVPPLPELNTVTSQPALDEGLRRWAGQAAYDEICDLGARAGRAEARGWAVQANENEPVLRTHSPTGERLDEVDFHPAWHELMTVAVGAGLTAEPWTQPSGSHAHVRRAAGFIAWSENEQGHLCPVSMTYAAAPALAANPALAGRWLPQLASRSYDFGLRPVAQKSGALVGMGMTEKQGGSDVRANTTRAVATQGGPVEGGDTYRLTGHKWFCSAPMSDAFLVLAQTEAGVGCFLVPRALDDGTRNPFALQRLKDKLGNRSNASSEIELDGTLARRLGDEGRGVRTIIEMVAATRLDCVLGSASLMRHALAEASWHVAHRSAFGSLLADKPLMQNVVADLAVESEAATALAIRLAAAVDGMDAPHDAAHERALRRIALPLAKFWVCKRTPGFVAEALECLGGNGYVEDSGLPLLYREAPLNSVWEGSGNVNALDVLRALAREPEALAAWITEVGFARGADARLDRAVDDTLTLLGESGAQEAGARRLAGRMAACLQGSLLVRYAPAEVADAFCGSRLGGSYDGTYGTLSTSAAELRTIVERTTPTV